MAANLTTLSNAAKTLFTDKEIEMKSYKDRPLWAMLPKETDFIGKSMIIPFRTAPNAARSHTFSTSVGATGNASSSAWVQLTVTRAKDYSHFFIDGETADALTGRNAGSFIDALENEMEGAVQNASETLAREIYGNGGAALAKGDGAYSVAGAVATLSKKADIIKFYPNQVIRMASTDGTSGSLRAGSLTVQSVDRDAGTVTFTGNVNAGVTSPVNTDYFFIDGDFGLGIKGLDIIVPGTAPSAANDYFTGLDRTVDPQFLAGVRVDATGLMIEEAIQLGLTKGSIAGAKPKKGFLHPDRFLDLKLSLQSHMRYDMAKTTVGEIGFEGVKIIGTNGTCEIYEDAFCSPDVCWLLTMDKLRFKSIGKAPKLRQQDGLTMLRSQTADEYVGAYLYYGQMICDAPGQQVRVKLA